MFTRKTAEDVLRLYAALSDEEKAKVRDGLKPNTEDEEQIAEAKSDIAAKGEEDGTKDQTERDVEDESVGEQERLDGNEDSQTAKDRIDESEATEKADEERKDEQTEENKNEVYTKLADRVSAIEDALKELNELKSQMEEFTAKQADNFGYKGKALGGKKDIHDMTADELKKEILG